MLSGDWTPSRYPHPSPHIRMRMFPPRVPEGEGMVGDLDGGEKLMFMGKFENSNSCNFLHGYIINDALKP